MIVYCWLQVSQRLLLPVRRNLIQIKVTQLFSCSNKNTSIAALLKYSNAAFRVLCYVRYLKKYVQMMLGMKPKRVQLYSYDCILGFGFGIHQSLFVLAGGIEVLE